MASLSDRERPRPGAWHQLEGSTDGFGRGTRRDTNRDWDRHPG